MINTAAKRALALGIAATGLLFGAPQAVTPALATPAAPAVGSAPAVRSAPAVWSATAQGVCSSTPFRSKPSAHRWYRIPAIVRSTDGTLVAFAEQRDTMSGDDGDFDVVRVRSTDHGCSWSTPAVIGDDGTNRVSNPVPIVDATTGRILLFSVITPRQGSDGTGKGLYLQTSSDDGLTFSALLGHPVRPSGTYHGGLTGPGHGIQLTLTHPGRLILPMGYRTSQGLYGAYAIYSDDHGATWRTGFDQQDTTGKVNFIEGSIAELPSGDLFISYRDLHDGARAGTARQYATSTDGGVSLSRPFTRLPLDIVSVQGSALALAGQSSGELLFSAPAVTTANLRRDMTVFISTTAGRTWTAKYQVELQDTPAAYSDLVQPDASSIGVLYETGTVTWKERIAFESMPIATLTHPTPVGSAVSYQRSTKPTHAWAHAKVMTTVKVAGIGSPPGRVTLAYQRDGATSTAHSVGLDLTYSNRGVRLITLPTLKPGTYHLRLTYSGTGRIARATRSAGLLHVVK